MLRVGHTMQIICTDGTTIQCDEFEAIDSGVLFFQETAPRQEAAEEDDDEDAEPDDIQQRASGFIPLTQLQFVLPDEMVQQPRQRAGAPQPQSGHRQAGGQAGGMAQQQQMQQPPSQMGPQGGQ